MVHPNYYALCGLSAYGSSVAMLSAIAVYAGRQFVAFGNMNLVTGGAFGIAQVMAGLALTFSIKNPRDSAPLSVAKYIVSQLFTGSCCYMWTLLAVKIGVLTSTLSFPGAAFFISANIINSVASIFLVLSIGEKLAPLYESSIPKIKNWINNNKFKKIEYLLNINILILKPIVCSLFTTFNMKAVYFFNPALKTSLWPIALFSVIQDVVATCLTSYLDKKQIFSKNIHLNFIISHIATGAALYSLLGGVAQAGALAPLGAAIAIGSTLAIGFGVTKMSVSLVRKLYFNEAKYLEYSIRQDSKY